MGTKFPVAGFASALRCSSGIQGMQRRKEADMNYIVNAEQMQEIDRRTIEEIGIPSLVLMEKAAEALAAEAGDMAACGNNKAQTRILAVCGTGGNGGDAIAAARILHFRGYRVSLWLAGEESRMTGSALQELKIAGKCGVPEIRQTGTEPDFGEYDILLDGLFGVGLSREITGHYRETIEKMNASGARILAVDIPSGIHAGTGECMGVCIQAERTVTFGERKIGQLLYPGAAACGRLITADIGFPPFLTEQVVREQKEDKSRNICCMSCGAEDIARLPVRTAYSNKGTYGKVLVIAGSEEVTGAAYLAARAAYQCGVGLVKLLSSPGCISTVRHLLPELLTGVLPEEEYEFAERIRKETAWADVILAGPGIGTGERAKKILTCSINEAANQKKPLLLDADALNLLAAGLRQTKTGERIKELAGLLPAGTVLTPHLKELSRLTGLETGWIAAHLIDTAKQCTYNNELIYVIKDARTITAYRDEFCLNTSGCDGMATGGSGDVLAGMIAGLMTGMKPEEAAGLGVYLHGLSGEKAAERAGRRGMLAGDILEAFHY